MRSQFRRLFPFLFVAAVPFLLISLLEKTTSSKTSDDPAGNGSVNFDIRNDRMSEVWNLLLERSGNRLLTEASILERTKPIQRAASELKTRRPDVKIEFNGQLGSAETMAPAAFGEMNMLTPASKDARQDILRNFLKQNSSLFAIGASEIDSLAVTADYTNPDGNLSFVHLEHSIGGVPVFGGEIKAGFTKRNEIIRIVNGLAPYAPSSVPGDFGDQKAIADNLLADRRGEIVRDSAKFYFPIAAGVLRPSWRFLIESERTFQYVVVDAETGIILWRKNLVEHQSQTATYEVYGNSTSMMRTADSPSPGTPWCPAPTGCAQPPAVARTQFTLIGNEAPYAFNNLGWIADGENRTFGNNAEVGIDRVPPNGIDPDGWAVGNPNRSFAYSYNPAPGLPAPGEAPLPSTQTFPPSAFQQGVIAHAFYLTNRFHDETYLLGFNEAARNFQAINFGRGGLENDPLSVELQDVSATNGANFATPADGTRPRGQMFIWTGPTPDRDGGLDSQVLTHELTHGLSNRLHGNVTGLTGNMARGMGEGWSDFYALALLSEPTDAECGTSAVAGYVTYEIVPGFEGNYYHGIRRFPTARRQCTGPNGRPHNPVTFRYLNSDCNTLIGTTTSNPPPSSAFPRGPIGTTICDQIHNMGEVWASILWEVRGELIAIHGATEGNRRALQYLTDGMKISPINPTMLQSRDAVIAAAAASSAPDVLPVRRGFAIRGLGASASIINAGTGSNDTVVIEAFDVFSNVKIAPGFTVSDSVGNNNGFPEPGERVTVTVPLLNNSGETITGVNLFSPTLGASAFYGDFANGQTISRSFAATIPAGAPCGGNFEIAFSLTSSVGQSTEMRTIFTGAPVETATFASTTPVTINESGPATPYATSVNVSGLTLGNQRITLEMTGLTHTFPGDVDLLLVGPGGQLFVPMSDAGGTADVSQLTFSLSDLAAGQLSSSALTAGSFKPTSFVPADIFASPAPSGPYLEPAPAGTSSFSSAFGSDGPGLNGTWTLYVNDDAAGDSGSLAGWKLKFESYACPFCRVCLNGARSDFDADGRTDLAVFRPSDGVWYQNRSVEGFSAAKWGVAGDRITPGDFDADAKTDLAVFRPDSDPSQPDFYVLNSANATFNWVSFGIPSDIPVIADYDGDGRDDLAVYRPSNHTFYVLRSGAGGVLVFSNISFGTPVAGDFDGDGRADFATYSIDGWFLSPSNINYATVNFIRFGAQGDKPVPGDYDGDGKDDFAVFRPSDQVWYVRRSSGGTTFFRFGLGSDLPVPGDYDGDGKLDFAVYRDGIWYIESSSGGGTLIRQFGLAGDAPVPAGYLP